MKKRPEKSGRRPRLSLRYVNVVDGGIHYLFLFEAALANTAAPLIHCSRNANLDCHRLMQQPKYLVPANPPISALMRPASRFQTT